MKKIVIFILTVFMTLDFAFSAMAANELPDNTKHLSQNPHQNYTENTAACASCHSTHKAAGPKLLSGSNTYDSCTNCHNGTESVYDVLDGKVYNTTDTTSVDANAGLFGSGDISGNTASSRHAANSGTGIDMTTLNGGMGAEGQYTGADVFTCANCHDPHKKLSDTTGLGTYNARLLKAAPRMVAKEDSKATLLYQAGAPATLKINASSNSESVLSGSFGGFMNTYPQQPKLYIWDAVNGYVEIASTNWTFDGATGVFTPVSPYVFDQLKTYKASFWPKAPQVTITYDNWRSNTGGTVLTTAETPHYVASINKWCGTCHNDYTLGSKTAPVGDYIQAFRHPVGTVDAKALLDAAKTGTFIPKIGGTSISGGAATINLPLTDTTNQITCLTCHFAHGSKATSALASDNVTGFNDASGVVTNNGKLLRYDNRDTCEACHNK